MVFGEADTIIKMCTSFYTAFHHSLKLLQASFSLAYMACLRRGIYSHPTTTQLARRLTDSKRDNPFRFAIRVEPACSVSSLSATRHFFTTATALNFDPHSAPAVWQIDPTVPFEQKCVVPRCGRHSRSDDTMDQAQGHKRWADSSGPVRMLSTARNQMEIASIVLRRRPYCCRTPTDLIKTTWDHGCARRWGPAMAKVARHGWKGNGVRSTFGYFLSLNQALAGY
ncbi:hypothetical protein C8J56DRAFT_1170139 [Mycena floridula]|nr:hypothetical protein C8J56DRAFT_1170139 [Mycena floridula]